MRTPEPWEWFFVERANRGLYGKLTKRQQEILLTPVVELIGSGFDRELAEALQEKVFKGLSAAWQTDTGAGGRRAMGEWRRNLKKLHESSDLTLSGIVQNWYLRQGRVLEDANFGSGPGCVLLVVAGVVSTAVLLIRAL